MQKTVLFVLGMILFSTTGITASEISHAKDTRPNIFFFFADDWGRYASTYSQYPVNMTFQTPTFDKLAAEGVKFEHAHVMSPSCTPCRSALLSGQYFFRTGRASILAPAVWDGAIPTYPLLLEEAGYFIGHTYKVWAPGTPLNAPYGAYRTRYNRSGGRFNQFSQNVTQMIADGRKRETAKEILYRESLDNFQQFLESRPEGQPFCYWFGPTNTHRKWVKGSGKTLWDLDPDDLEGKMPPFLPDVPEIREDFCDYLGEVLALDAMLGRFVDKLRDIGELENSVIVVSGDHGIPGFTRSKSHLYEFGTGVSLFVRVGQNVKIDGYAPMQDAFRGRSVDDFVNLVDLAPTFCEIGGVEPLECMNGRSLLPLLLSARSGQVDPTRDYVITGRERHVASAREGMLSYPHRSILTTDYLYIRNFEPERGPSGDPYNLEDGKSPTQEEIELDTAVTYPDMDCGPTKAWLVLNRLDAKWAKEIDWAFGLRPEEELYDLANDPHCLVNVVDDEKYAEPKKTLSDRLMNELRSAGDPRVVGDNIYERPPFAGPFDENRTTPEENAKITAVAQKWVERTFPGWSISDTYSGRIEKLWGEEELFGMCPEYRGLKNVLMTTCINDETPARISGTFEIPQGKKTRLRFLVSCMNVNEKNMVRRDTPNSGWKLIVRIDGTVINERRINRAALESNGWLPVDVDLAPYQGRKINIELLNASIGSVAQTGYWAQLGLVDD